MTVPETPPSSPVAAAASPAGAQPERAAMAVPVQRALDAPARVRPSNYPEPYASMMAGRVKRPLGALFGLQNFGVNLTRLQTGSMSALRHAHTTQDEFVYVLEGEVVLATDDGEQLMRPGDCAGFRAGTGLGHHLINRSASDVLYLEVGDRSPGDEASYPTDDLKAALDGDGRWVFTRKNGDPL